MDKIYVIEVFDYVNGKVVGYSSEVGWETTFDEALNDLKSNKFDIQSDGKYGFVRLVLCGIYPTTSIITQIYKYNKTNKKFEPTDELKEEDLPDRVRGF